MHSSKSGASLQLHRQAKSRALPKGLYTCVFFFFYDLSDPARDSPLLVEPFLLFLCGSTVSSVALGIRDNGSASQGGYSTDLAGHVV
jgi:hypothetical protein